MILVLDRTLNLFLGGSKIKNNLLVSIANVG